MYWPTSSKVEIRDLGFIVADGSGWWAEVKAHLDYSVQWPDPSVPLATIVHHDPPEHPYKLQLEFVADPDRDVLLVRYALTDIVANVYALLASHLQTPRGANDSSGGSTNYGWFDSQRGVLHAVGDGRYLCLASDQGFARTSVGYFGYTDLWQDFAHNADT